MAVQDYMKPGYGGKQRVRILTSDPTIRRIEAALKDAGIIQVAVWDTPTVFRWPEVGEIWTVRKDSGYWVLDQRTPEAEQFDITTMEPGDVNIDAPTGVITANSATVITTENAGEILHTGTFAGMTPALAQTNPGNLYFAADDGGLYRSNGSIWVQIAAKVPTTPAWSSFSYQNSWGAYEFAVAGSFLPGYWKDRTTNVVYLRGLVQSFSPWTAFEAISTLPVGYRPQQRLLFTGNLSASTLGLCRIDVDIDGTIQFGDVYGDPFGQTFWAADNWVSLDNIRFPTA